MANLIQSLSGLTAPFTKLIEVVSDGIGALYTPRRIRKEADARAYEIVTIEKAKTAAEINRKEQEFLSLNRIEQRLLAKEEKRQKNLDDIVDQAAAILKTKEKVSKEKVDTDWATRFINIAQDISDEDMKRLWAQILSGEVEKPRSYSLRTLECLKNMSKYDADLFVDFADYVISGGFILNSERETEKLKFDSLLHLSEVGLYSPQTSLQINFAGPDFYVVYQNIFILVKSNNSKHPLNMPVYTLTEVGRELFKLTTPKFHPEYFNKLIAQLKGMDNVSVYQTKDFSKTSDGQYNYNEESLEKC